MKPTLLFLAFMFLFFQYALAQNYILDNTFGTGGQITNSTITSHQDIQLQSDGKIISCFYSNPGTSLRHMLSLIRLNSDGSTDTSFGTNGIVNTTLSMTSWSNQRFRIQNDGKIIVAGDYITSANITHISIVRYNINGTIDSSFGSNGYSNSDLISANAYSNEIELQDDGKILVGGYTMTNNTNEDIIILRYMPNGLIDTSFSGNGFFIYNFGSFTSNSLVTLSKDYLSAIRINSAGKIIIGANTNKGINGSGFEGFGFICLNSNGVLDASFGTNGQTICNFANYSTLTDLEITSDNKIIATGRTRVNFLTRLALVKLLDNGVVDSSFGSNGYIEIFINSSTNDNGATDLIIQPDGKIICFGNIAYYASGTYDFLLARFTSNGERDLTFNSTGYITINFSGSMGSIDLGSTFLIQNDGKILCAGVNTYQPGCLARLKTDGLSTNSFTNNELVVYPNPFTNSLTISTKDIDLSLATIELYDISGRKISNFTTENTNNFTFSVNANLSKGNYILKVTNKDKVESFKIVKQ